jgi:hypothetical protein
LALMVMALLVAAVGVGVGGSVEREYLDEGAQRVETVLRLARAEAAQHGRTLRVGLNETGDLAVSWEPRPLEEPGVFYPYTESAWAQALPNEMVRVIRSVVSGVEAYRPPSASDAFTNDSGDEDPSPEAILFYPDGSCDTATLGLRSSDASDPRTAVIEVDGVNSLFTTRVMTSQEWEDYRRPGEQVPR